MICVVNMGRRLFSDIELGEKLREGKNSTEIATELGVSRQAVAKRVQQYKLNIAKEVTLHQVGRVAQQQLDASAQLQRINKSANQLLDLLVGVVKAEDPDCRHKALLELEPILGSGSVIDQAVKLQAEIRQQLKLAFDIRKDLIEIERMQQVLNIILEAIGRAAPQVRDSIIAELKSQSILRSAMGWD